VYVIPPNAILRIERNRLVVLPPPEPRGFRMPVDHFFASLGEEQRQRAVGILFSGTGSDGTNGLRAIKSSGGLTGLPSVDAARGLKYTSEPWYREPKEFFIAEDGTRDMQEEYKRFAPIWKEVFK